MSAVVAVSRNEAYAFSKPVRDQIILIAGLGVEGDAHAGTTVKHRSRVRVDPWQPNLRQVHLMAAELFDEVRAQGYRVAPGQLGENVTTRGIDLLRLPRGTILRFGSAPLGVAEPGPDGSAALAGVLAAARRTTMSDETTAALAAVEAAAARDGRARPQGRDPGTYPENDQRGHGPAQAENADRGLRQDERHANAGRPDPRPAVIVTGLRNPCAQINGLHDGLLKCVLWRDDAGNPVRRAGVMGVVLRGGPVRPGDRVTVDLPSGPHLPLEPV